MKQEYLPIPNHQVNPLIDQIAHCLASNSLRPTVYSQRVIREVEGQEFSGRSSTRAYSDIVDVVSICVPTEYIGQLEVNYSMTASTNIISITCPQFVRAKQNSYPLLLAINNANFVSNCVHFVLNRDNWISIEMAMPHNALPTDAYAALCHLVRVSETVYEELQRAILEG